MYTYRQIFIQALKVSVYYPSLWFFGFFVALLGSSSGADFFFGSYGFGSRSMLYSFWSGLAEGGLFTPEGVRGLMKVLITNPIYLFVIVLLFLIIFGISILLIFLGTTSQVGLIDQLVGVSKNRPLSFKKGFQTGLTKFWPALGLNIVLKVILFVMIGLPALFSFFSFPGSTALFIIIFDISFLVILILSFIIKYAICAISLRNISFLDSLKSAWKIFLANWLLSLEIALIIFALYMVVNSILLWFFSSIVFGFLKLFTGFIFGLIFLFVIALLFFIFVQIVLTIFHWAIWAIIFELVSNPKYSIKSKINIGFDKLFG